jgi:hypothetical protein
MQFRLNLMRILRMCVQRLWELLRSMKLFMILWHSVIFPFLKSRLCLRGGHVPGDSLEDRRVTATVKHSLQSLLMIVVAFLSSTGACRMKLIQ